MPPASKSAKPCCPTCGARPKASSGQQDWSALIQALHAQSAALERLAASNEAIVDALLSEYQDDSEGGSEHL